LIDHSSCLGKKIRIKGCLVISVHDVDPAESIGRLARFRREFHRSMTARADALFELTDALLCGGAPVRSLVELSLTGEHRRGHGSLYAALNRGRVDIAALKTAIAAVAVPRAADGRIVLAADGRIVLAVDVTCWLRPEAHTSAQRVLCHTYGRGKDTHMMIPGWPYSLVTALEAGRSSWTAPLEVRRLAPGDDAATVTAAQLREVVHRVISAGHWQPGDPDMWIVADAGYDGPGWRSCSPTCRCGCWSGCAPTGCCAGSHHPGCHGTAAASPAMAASSSSATRAAGASRTPPPRPTPGFTAPRPPGPGTGCTPG
jgi:hypothetical protein